MDHVNEYDEVWYDDNPGTVRSVNLGLALVDWDNGARTIVDQSDLVPMTEYEANISFRNSTERPIEWTDLPTWIRTEGPDSVQSRRQQQVKWTRSRRGTCPIRSYWPDGTLMAKWERKS